MRLLILSVLWFLAAMPASALCSGPSFLDRLSPEEAETLRTRAARTPYPEGLFWQASKGPNRLTIVGTMHIYDPRLERLIAPLIPRLAEAELLLVEATATEEAEMQRAMATDPDMIFINEGPTLPEILDDETWQAVSDAVRSRQIPPFMAAKMRPWYLSLTLAIPPCAILDLASGARGLDHMLMAEAEELGVAMRALEPWTTLIDMMRRGTEEEQIEMLKLGLLAPDIQSEMFVAMLDAYFAGEIAAIWEASRLSATYVPGLDPDRAAALFAEAEALLLKERNLRWIPVIEAAATEADEIMIAVGAAHLPGEYGILRLLEAEGWYISAL